MALWLQILKLNTKAYGVQKVLAKYRVGNGISQNKFEMAIWQWILYRDVLGLPLISSVFYMFTYFFLGAIKHVK